MVSLIVRFTFATEDRSSMLEAARQLAIESRKEPGNLAYLPNQPEDDLDSLVIVEQYKDEAALSAHRNSEHFKKYCVSILYQKMKDRSTENLIALA